MAAGSSRVRSKVFLRSESKVKFDFSTVRSRVIPILKRVEVGDYPSKIGRIYGWSKQHVAYYLKKLQKAGLVRRKKRTNAVFYELTPKGQNFLVSCEGVVFGSGVYRLHRCMVKYRIKRAGFEPTDFRKVEMVNWTALLGLEHGVKVRKTPSSWIVHVETLYGKHPGELFSLAKQVADRVASHLSLKYGCRLDDGEVCRGYEYGIDDPVAQLLSRYFCVSTGRRKMDHSLGEEEGEVDHLSRDAAVEYLLMPERVKALEGKVDAMSPVLEHLEAGVQELLDLFRPVLDRAHAETSPRDVRSKDLSYVS